MARIKVKLKELRNADVRYISLVDRAASRIPFRVQKRNEETDMGIDLTRVFKGTQKPVVAEVIVFAQKKDETTDAIRQSIAAAGFETDRVQKADAETVSYAQGPQTGGDTVLVRLSDQMVVKVRHFPEATGFFADVVKKHGFYPGLSDAMGLAHDALLEAVKKGEGAADILDHFHAYAQALLTLPETVHKCEAAVSAIVAKDAPKEEAVKEEMCEGCKNPKAACKCSTMKEEEPAQKTEEELAAAKKAEEDAAAAEATRKAEEEAAAKKAEEDAAAAKKAEEEKAQKSDLSPVLDAIKSLAETVSGLATKVDGVVETQTTQQKALDEVVKKTDAVVQKVENTVIAPEPGADRVPGGSRVKKTDEEFVPVRDTAFDRRRK